MLDKSIPDSLIHLPAYSLVRFDRNRNSGGVCAYIRSSINFRRHTSLESDNLELLALEVNKPNSKPFLVYCWYRPTHSPVEYFDILEQLVNKAESFYTDIYITGDLIATFCRTVGNTIQYALLTSWKTINCLR